MVGATGPRGHLAIPKKFRNEEGFVTILPVIIAVPTVSVPIWKSKFVRIAVSISEERVTCVK